MQLRQSASIGWWRGMANNPLRPRQDDRRFVDDIFICIF